MSQSLLTHGFRWSTQSEIDQIVLAQLADKAPDGYIYKIELDYPSHLHRKNNAYPLAPERITIDDIMLSPQQRTFPKHQQQTTTKLSPNIHAKNNYVDHCRNLKLYHESGMVTMKIHRVQTFNQSRWLKPYIQFNIRMRAATTSQFVKDLLILMNNIFFGRTQENLRNRINVEDITNEQVELKRVCKPNEFSLLKKI